MCLRSDPWPGNSICHGVTKKKKKKKKRKSGLGNSSNSLAHITEKSEENFRWGLNQHSCPLCLSFFLPWCQPHPSLDSLMVPRYLAIAPGYMLVVSVQQGRGSIFVTAGQANTQRHTLIGPAWFHAQPWVTSMAWLDYLKSHVVPLVSREMSAPSEQNDSQMETKTVKKGGTRVYWIVPSSQNLKPNQPRHLWSINLQQRRQEYKMGKRQSLQQVMLGKTGQPQVNQWNGNTPSHHAQK